VDEDRVRLRKVIAELEGEPMNATFSDSAAPATAEQVTRDANLIARNLECLGATDAATATADHIRKFWAPLLRSTLLVQARAHGDRFSPIVSDAIALLERDSGAGFSRPSSGPTFERAGG
jgi:hypothetical protein